MFIMPSTADTPVSPERLMAFTFGFAPPLMIEAAIRHGVFNALDRGAKTIDALCAETGTLPRGLRTVLNALVGLDLLSKDEAGQTSWLADGMSALPRKADIGTQPRDVRFVPKVDICAAAKPLCAINSSARPSRVCSSERPSAAPTSVAHRCQPNSGTLEGISIDKNFKFDAVQQPPRCSLFQF